jgi:hypothetical protein
MVGFTQVLYCGLDWSCPWSGVKIDLDSLRSWGIDRYVVLDEYTNLFF